MTKKEIENCSDDNALTSFMPSETVIQTWFDKIKANGVVEGSPVRLIGGKDAGKIVTFSFNSDKWKVNDRGISSTDVNTLGWFYNEKTDTAVYPIYRILNNAAAETPQNILTFIGTDKAIGCKITILNNLVNTPLSFNILGNSLTSDINDGLVECYTAINTLSPTSVSKELYSFKYLNDFYAWLEQQY